MKWFLATLALFAAACGDTTAPSPEAQLRLIQRQESRWFAQGIANYDFDLTTGGAWFPVRTWRIEVRGGVGRRITQISGPVISFGSQPAIPLDYLFERAREALTGPCIPEACDRPVLALDFDSRYAFMSKVSSDIPRYADDEWWMSVANFVRR